MKNFSSILFHTIPESDLAELSDCEKGAIVKVQQELCSARQKGKPQIMISRTSCENAGDERTVIDIVANDRPFLVDSIVAEVNRHSLLIDFLIHPYIYAKFDPDKGNFLSATNEKDDGALRQSHIHIRLHRLGF